MTDGLVSEQALMAHRKTGVVDERLLGVLRFATLVCGVDQAGGTPSPAVREIEGNRVLLAWTSARRAADAGWTGPVVERTGAQVAALLRGTGLGLAINVGHTASVGLDVTGVEHLGDALPDT